ncbi:MAG: hypothetical protein R3F08_15020 [Dokdonella sp.]
MRFPARSAVGHRFRNQHIGTDAGGLQLVEPGAHAPLADHGHADRAVIAAVKRKVLFLDRSEQLILDRVNGTAWLAGRAARGDPGLDQQHLFSRNEDDQLAGAGEDGCWRRGSSG